MQSLRLSHKNLFLVGRGPHHMACGILVPSPMIETSPPAVEAWNPNHRVAREFPRPGNLQELFWLLIFHKSGRTR